MNKPPVSVLLRAMPKWVAVVLAWLGVVGAANAVAVPGPDRGAKIGLPWYSKVLHVDQGRGDDINGDGTITKAPKHFESLRTFTPKAGATEELGAQRSL
jgi:hypothetical protein